MQTTRPEALRVPAGASAAMARLPAQSEQAQVRPPVVSGGRLRAVLVVCSLAAFMAFLDATIVNVAFPSIQRSFPHVARSWLSWVLNGYNIVFAALLVPAGQLADLVGRRRVFLVNVPLGATALMMGRRVLREQHDLEYGRVPDLIAIGLLTGTVSLVALGLTQGPNWGWGDTRVISSFVGATALVAALAWRSRSQPWTTSNLSLRLPSVRFANVAILLFACAFYAKILTDVLFLTSIWHYTVLAAGAAITPGPLITAALAGPAGRLADRYGLVPIAGIGAVIYAAGCAWYAVRAGTHADYVIRWLPGTAFTGIGIAMAFPTLTTAAVQGLPARLYAT